MAEINFFVDIIMELQDVNPTWASLQFDLPYLECDVVDEGPNKAFIPADNPYRIVGNYVIRITSRNSTSFPISFKLAVSLEKPAWYPQSPKGSPSGEMDLAAFAIIFSISILISLLMVFLIHRARQSLQEVQDRQFSAFRMHGNPISIPQLYCAVLDLFVRAPAVSPQVYVTLPESPVTEPLHPPQITGVDQRAVLTKWGSALQNVPQLFRRLTWSISNLDLFAAPKRIKWVKL
jgi:hypothetical protein